MVKLALWVIKRISLKGALFMRDLLAVTVICSLIFLTLAAFPPLLHSADMGDSGESGQEVLFNAIKFGELDKARELIENGVDVNGRDRYLKAPIHYAAAAGDFPILKMFVSQGAKVNAWDANGQTALHLSSLTPKYRKELALGYGEKVLSYLVSEGADLNQRDNDGNTALHLSCSKNYPGAVEELLELGADLTAENNNGKKPSQLAPSGSKSLEIVEEEEKKRASSSISPRAGNRPRPVLREPTIPPPAYVSPKQEKTMNTGDVRNSRGMTLLHKAAEAGDLEKAKELIKDGANPDITNLIRQTALHMAIYAGHSELARFLIKSGTNLEIGNMGNQTALHAASMKGMYYVVKLLLEKGANINAVSKRGYTPLHWAVKKDHGEVVALLRKHGAR